MNYAAVDCLLAFQLFTPYCIAFCCLFYMLARSHLLRLLAGVPTDRLCCIVSCLPLMRLLDCVSLDC